MKTLAQILKSKATQGIATVSATASAREAALLMAKHEIGALLVMDGERIAGIVSERDFARKLVPFERAGAAVPVTEIMTVPVMYVESTRSGEDCMTLMTNNRLRHLPVFEHGKLIGMVSIGDLVKDVISDQQFAIEQLEYYITGMPNEAMTHH